MAEETLTFSDLRKIEKTENRQDELSELDSDFLLKASRYLDRKEDADDREYRNAKRVIDKIIGLRQDKIMKNAKLSVKTEVKASKLNMLPREQEFFREIRKKFEEYSAKIDQVIEKEPEEIDVREQEDEDESEEGEENVREEYQKVRAVSEIPEFMGTDLESYGPFEEGEEVEIPEENADILVNRGSAERV